MSHFSYACKTERQNDISRLIFELLRTLDSSLMVYSHWLSPGLGPVLCRTFHITPGPGQGRSPGKRCLHALNKAPFSPRSHVIVLIGKT